MTSKEMNNIEENVKSLYEMMQDEKIEVLDIKSDDIKLYIRRKNPNAQSVQAKGKVAPSLVNNSQIQDAVQQTTAQNESQEGSSITSPITGVFYRSPSPSSPMFVKEGDVVDVGKTLCIIEAMKVMNEIKATEKVKILKILVENGSPITTGQSLFSVEKL